MLPASSLSAIGCVGQTRSIWGLYEYLLQHMYFHNTVALLLPPSVNLVRFTTLSGHYCNQLYDAVLMATTRSLVTLAESSGCQGDTIRAASAFSEAPSRDSHTPRSGSQSRATSAVSDRSRPVSVLSMLSNITWTTEMSAEVTYLQ